MLAWLARLLDCDDKKFGQVLHIGSGAGSELNLYDELNFQEILVIEPSDVLFKKLKSKAKRFKNVSVEKAWISDKESEQQARHFNNPRFNSLLSANKKLSEFFPNLKQQEVITVTTKSFCDFVTKKVRRVDNKLNILVLEVQGLEGTILQNTTIPVLSSFDWVIVKTSNEALYESAMTATQLKVLMKQYCFDLRLIDDDKSAFVEQYYQVNKSKIELNQTRGHLQTVAEQFNTSKIKLNESKQLISEEKQHITKLKQEKQELVEMTTSAEASLTTLEKKLAESYKAAEVSLENKDAEIDLIKVQLDNLETYKHNAEENLRNLKSFNEELRQEVQALKKSESDKNSKIVMLESELQELAALLSASKKSQKELNDDLLQETSLKDEYKELAEERALNVDNLEQERKELEKAFKTKFDSLGRQLSHVENELKDSQKRLDVETVGNKERQQIIASLQKRIDHLQQSLNERQKSADLALKLQLKAQCDLDDLREKFSDKCVREQQLVDLIKELRVKLQEASEYYFYLQANHSELVNSLPDSLSNVQNTAHDSSALTSKRTVKSSKTKAAKKHKSKKHD